MTTHVDIWQFVGGIGLFLFAMAQLETALRSFAGRSLRHFLQSYTDKPLKSVATGTIATAALQSSSLVSLLVLAFVGASIISLENALGVVFGANLGTTLTGWVVTTLGFKLQLEEAALPLIGVGSLVLVGLKGRVAEMGRTVAALGFLLMGLSLMKDSVSSLGDAFDIEQLKNLAAWQYLCFGVLFAAIVQSSSAAMVVTLSALHSGVIDLPSAAAVAVGADLGTTSTVLIGAIRGSAAKKRVALAHFIFNVATAVLAFSLLTPLLGLIHYAGISDPLFSLVTFHSLFNFLGIALFLPLTKSFARILERFFARPLHHESLFVSETSPAVPNAALVALNQETAHIIGRIIHQNRHIVSPEVPLPSGRLPVDTPNNGFVEDRPFDELYRRNKRLEGEIVSYALKIQAEALEPTEIERLNRLLSAVRHAVHSAKSLRDVRHNLEEFADSPKDDVNDYLEHFTSVLSDFYGEVFRLRSDDEAQVVFQDFSSLIQRVQDWQDQLHRRIYADIDRGKLADFEISSLLNVNREVFNSNNAMTMALQEFLLSEEEAVALNQMPGVGGFA